MRSGILAAGAALALALAAGPAGAQYYDEGYGPRRYGPPPGYDDDEPPPPRRYRRYPGYGGGPGGSVCVTARGNCLTRPAPFNTPCACDIPGFGIKRGAVGG